MREPGRELPPPEHKTSSIACDESNGGSSWRGCSASCTPASGRCARGHNGSGSSSSSSPPRGAPATELPTVGDVLRCAKALLQPAHQIERQFYADCYRACQVTPASGGSRPPSTSPPSPSPSAQAPAPPAPLPYLSSVAEVALRLSCLGHRVVVRRVTDSQQYWSRSMANLFCYCVLPGTGIGYVLDPGFKETFRAGYMSDRYRDIWECLPPLFVGPPAKLVHLVRALSFELASSFQGAGREVPPWRTFNSTISRWMSPVFKDLPVPMRRPMQPLAAAAAATAAAGAAGMIPAAEARAFLRACDELLAGTASGRPRGATGVAATAPTTAAAGGSAAARGVAAAAAAGSGAGAGPGTAGGSGASCGGAAGEERRREGGGAAAGAAVEAAAQCSGDVGRPAAQVSDDGGSAAAAAVAAGRLHELSGCAATVGTAATAAASSAARGPPPRPEWQPLRTIAGFELGRAPTAAQPPNQ